MHFSEYTNIKDITVSVKKKSVLSDQETFGLVQIARN